MLGKYSTIELHFPLFKNIFKLLDSILSTQPGLELLTPPPCPSLFGSGDSRPTLPSPASIYRLIYPHLLSCPVLKSEDILISLSSAMQPPSQTPSHFLIRIVSCCSSTVLQYTPFGHIIYDDVCQIHLKHNAVP